MAGPAVLRARPFSTRFMDVMTSIEAATAPDHPASVIHPGWVRATHWINAIAMLVMIGSGWQIYNASPLPLFRFEFPPNIALGGWLGGSISWHLASKWLLAADGLVYVTHRTAYVLLRS